MSLRDKILSTPHLERELVEVPGWGVTVEVRSMSMRSRAQMFKDAMKDGEVDSERFYSAIVVACCYDPETGEKLFTDGDVDTLADEHAGIIEHLALVGQRLSGLDKKAVDSGKDDS